MEIFSVRFRPIGSDTNKIVSIGDDIEYRDLGEIKKGKIAGFHQYQDDLFFFVEVVEGRDMMFWVEDILP